MAWCLVKHRDNFIFTFTILWREFIYSQILLKVHAILFYLIVRVFHKISQFSVDSLDFLTLVYMNQYYLLRDINICNFGNVIGQTLS
jgi:hypothetical protein